MSSERPSLFSFYLENPLKTWWKAREHFKFPNLRLDYWNWKDKYKARILDIQAFDLDYKSKYNSLRHVEDPKIEVTLFGRFSICIWFTKNGIDDLGNSKNYSIEYWEYILNYLYGNHKYNLYKTFKDNIWTTTSKILADGKMDQVIPYHLVSLNKKGIRMFNHQMDHK